jgi:hypothetical protein
MMEAIVSDTYRSDADQLRRDIDSGATGDKVRASDPAAAPLGTDEEAAGTPTPPGAFDLERQEQARLADRITGKDQPDPALANTPTLNWRVPAALLVAAVAVVAALAMLR